MVLVLSRPDAVTTWKRVIGPTDPEAAREQAPVSLVTVFSLQCCVNEPEEQSRTISNRGRQSTGRIIRTQLGVEWPETARGGMCNGGAGRVSRLHLGLGSQDERAVPVPENFVIFPRNVMFWCILSHILK